MTFWPPHPESSTPDTVATLELDAVEADWEARDSRSRLVWRWSHDGRVVRVVVAGVA